MRSKETRERFGRCRTHPRAAQQKRKRLPAAQRNSRADMDWHLRCY